MQSAARRILNRLITGLTPAAGQPIAPTGDAQPGFQPIMETYGVPKEMLVKWIEAHGGQIVHIQPDTSVGKEWESFRYYITKP